MAWDISHKLTKKGVAKLPKEAKKYVVYANKNYILMQSPAKYANHSCDANTRADNFCDVANRDIMKGEEITVNYSETMAPDEHMICKCGYKNCKGIIKLFSPQQ